MQRSTAETRPIHHAFVNPFQLEDLLIFDQENHCRIIKGCLKELTITDLAWGTQAGTPELVARLCACLSPEQSPLFLKERIRAVPQCEVESARSRLLHMFFWELTYWKTPQLYEELTVGELLHPAIFQQLEPLLHGKVVLDAGAGSGRATFEALRYGARLIHAVEPSPGLLHLLQRKVRAQSADRMIVLSQGDFAHLPLPDGSVDTAIACSAFTSKPEAGGEAGLAEFQRVTRSGGSIVLIWPRPEDLCWLRAHGFRYVTFPCPDEMCVHFQSIASARRCVRRFYAGNQQALAYIIRQRQTSEIPFSTLGFHPPCDYCWLSVS